MFIKRSLISIITITVIAVAALVVSIETVADASSKTQEAQPPNKSSSIVIQQGGTSDTGIAWELAAATMEDIRQREINAYLEAVEEERLAQAERVRQQIAASSSANNSSNYHPGTTDGECTGFVIPDYIIKRESGGNPSAYNPSGAYGCAQTLLSHYQDGRTCQGLDPFTIDGQRECVYRLSNGGSNLAPWAF